MTVRVTKPEFNLREKLTELDKPTGLKGSELMRSNTVQEARDLIGAGRKNLVINGSFKVDQRHSGSSVDASISGKYGADRWKSIISNNSKFSMDREGADDTAFGNFTTYMRLTTTSAHTVGSNQFFLLWQTIEAKDIFDRTGFGEKGAKDLSLSFWVRSSVPGPFSGSLENIAQNRCFVWEVDISQANVWEYKTVHISGETSGTWPRNTAGGGAYLMFSMGTSITRTPNAWLPSQGLGTATEVKRIEISGATLDLTGIQLEIGKEATEFEYLSFTEDLLLCSRYYQQIEGYSDLIMFGSGRANGVNNAQVAVPLTVPLRTTPVISSLDYSTWGVSGANAVTDGQPTVTRWYEDSSIIHLGFDTSSLDNGRTAVVSCRNGSTLKLDAEL